jgi:hypothetical protein
MIFLPDPIFPPFRIPDPESKRHWIPDPDWKTGVTEGYARCIKKIPKRKVRYPMEVSNVNQTFVL